MRLSLAVLALTAVFVRSSAAEIPRVFPVGTLPEDVRLGELQTLNGYFPFQVVTGKEQWERRQAEIKRRILISQGLWPLPARTDLRAVVHKRRDYDDYSVEAVFFESVPGHYVTGSLYRPKGKSGPFPAVLCPHGHWRDARFYDAGEAAAGRSIATGAERFVNAARNHIQARCVQLARMGCIAFFYDMTGNCDSIQLGHRPDKSDHLDTPTDWGYFSVQADLRLQNMMGLQTWNSVRSIDFLEQLPDVDPKRIGVTGASGGGTQSMIIAAVDDRIAAAMPCVMVSTAMQGGCTCENAPLMRVGQGNIDIAAAIAPRPLALTAADDWTKELETKGYPDLVNLYEMLGHKDRLTAVFHTHFPHNYNHVNRVVMYGFFNRHFGLGFREPVLEQDFELLSKADLSVWDEHHPPPAGSQIGDSHEIAMLKMVTEAADRQMARLVPDDASQLPEYHNTVGQAWKTILGRHLDQVNDVSFTEVKQTQSGDFRLTMGQLNHVPAREQLPALVLQADRIESPRGVAIWITETGKSGLFENGSVIPEAAVLLNRGYAILSADLSGQGEFLPQGEPLDSQRMWYQRSGKQGWERFSGYTYGYNHSLFARRTHDVLSLIRHALTKASKQNIHLVGLDSTAGPVALAALSQSGDAIGTTIVDLKDFQFANLKRHDAPMFVPGAVRYLDVDGLLSVCSPRAVFVSGLRTSAVAGRVFAASGAADKLKIRDRNEIDAVLKQL